MVDDGLQVRRSTPVKENAGPVDDGLLPKASLWERPSINAHKARCLPKVIQAKQ